MPLGPNPITDAEYRRYGIEFLYHLTHVDNMPSILKHGLLSHNDARGLVMEDLSDLDVQDRRANHPPLDDRRPLHDYVCLYFNPRNPMLYRRREHQDDIVILCLDRRLLEQSSTFFTDGNAAAGATKFFNHPQDLAKLDWDYIQKREYWNNSEDGKRKRCAEILVPDAIPFDEVRRVCVRTDSTQTRLGELMSAAGRQATPIRLDRGKYFE